MLVSVRVDQMPSLCATSIDIKSIWAPIHVLNLRAQRLHTTYKTRNAENTAEHSRHTDGS